MSASDWIYTKGTSLIFLQMLEPSGRMCMSFAGCYFYHLLSIFGKMVTIDDFLGDGLKPPVGMEMDGKYLICTSVRL